MRRTLGQYRSATEPRLSSTAGKGSLLAIKLIVVGFALGLCVVSTRSTLWPIATWPMYHARTPEVPPPLVTVTQLRVIQRDGERDLLRPTDLMPAPWDAASKKLIELAFSPGPKQDRFRDHLTFLAEQALGGADVVEVEELDRTWRVDAYATPPLDLSDPVRETVRGRYVTDPRRLPGVAQ